MNKAYPDSVQKLIEEFGKLPGIGLRTAERLALYLLDATTEEAMALAIAIRNMKKSIKPCSICYNLSDTDPCHICGDKSRNNSIICIVENRQGVGLIENSGVYNGLYHVLTGNLSPLNGVNESDLTLDALKKRLSDNSVKEVIIATSPTLEGDATATLVSERLKDCSVKISRLARGVPQGAKIEHVSGAIIADALNGRTKLE
ncbi:MAG: recombination mediator RecR [Planctomycetota bacterium]